MNATIARFGHPATLIRDYAHWVVLLRPTQVTLGSLVLAAKSEARAFGDLPSEAFAELKLATSDIAVALASAVRPDRTNFLMLMMVDPHVHFHVLPRYGGERSGAGLTLADQSWPGPPDLGKAVKLDDIQMQAFRDWLIGHWPK